MLVGHHGDGNHLAGESISGSWAGLSYLTYGVLVPRMRILFRRAMEVLISSGRAPRCLDRHHNPKSRDLSRIARCASCLHYWDARQPRASGPGAPPAPQGNEAARPISPVVSNTQWPLLDWPVKLRVSMRTKYLGILGTLP